MGRPAQTAIPLRERSLSRSTDCSTAPRRGSERACQVLDVGVSRATGQGSEPARSFEGALSGVRTGRGRRWAACRYDARNGEQLESMRLLGRKRTPAIPAANDQA